MKATRPFKDKPWVIHYTPSWYDFFGIQERYEIDTKHPEWIRQVLIPAIKKYKK